ncbi:MauE/DoxX family redox-associated membrane protein [Actinophytocola sp. NPDC049390]|uniref:MauE/DoxX family redox-associated membrane protein n=1 Tax=Actinophytocola sp. NPDC049390 TaxID=3363894 RepID=UPI003790494A
MLDLVARALLVVVFVGAVAGKLRSARAFAEFVDSVAVLAPARLPARPVGALVVAAEGAAALLLLAPVTRLAGYALSVLMLVPFALGIARVVHSGQRVRCSCFGGGGGLLGRGHIVRNTLLVAAACLGALDGTAATTPGALVALTAGVSLGLVTVRWEDIAFLLRRPAPTGRNR